MRSNPKHPKTLVARALAASAACAIAAVCSPASAEVWSTNTAKQNILSGAPLVAKRISSPDTAQYCTTASTAQTHFTWVDTAGSAIDHNYAWALWATPCPTAVASMRGAELVYANRVDPVSGAIAVDPADRELTEQEIQRATDGGAVVLMVPVETEAEAAQVVKRTYFPPMGTRSLGPGQASALYGSVTADYRGSFNDNVVVIAIVSTVAGAAHAPAIARTAGIHAIFLDAMNLESSSGFTTGTRDYEKLANAIRVAAQSTRKHLCTADRTTQPHTLRCERKSRG